MKTLVKTILVSSLVVSTLFGAETTEEKPKKEAQDMSDPLAVYTQGGIGITNQGINIKIGQTYDTGNPETMGMNIIEIKGILGETLDWDGNSQKRNSIDSVRFRNMSVNLKNGRGAQIDVSYNFHAEKGTASYSFLQALPKLWRFNFYPLAGLGVAFDNNPVDGNKLPGTFGLVGMYSKLAITDKIWLNYNPIWSTTLSGADNYKNTGMQGESNVLAHEVALSYQITPIMNVRYFGNWTENIDYSNGQHRIELNYQF